MHLLNIVTLTLIMVVCRNEEPSDLMFAHMTDILVSLTDELDEVSSSHFTALFLPLVEEESTEKDLVLAVLK